MTATQRQRDSLLRLAAIQRRNGLAALAQLLELRAWRAGMAEQISERAA